MILEHVMFLNLPTNLEPTEVQNEVQLKTGNILEGRRKGGGGRCQGALPLPSDFTDIEIRNPISAPPPQDFWTFRRLWIILNIEPIKLKTVLIKITLIEDCF